MNLKDLKDRQKAINDEFVALNTKSIEINNDLRRLEGAYRVIGDLIKEIEDENGSNEPDPSIEQPAST